MDAFRDSIIAWEHVHHRPHFEARGLYRQQVLAGGGGALTRYQRTQAARTTRSGRTSGHVSLRGPMDRTHRKRATPKPKKKQQPWRVQPGQEGFNALATQKISDADLKLVIGCPRKGAGFKPMAYQATMAFLASPVSHGGPNDNPRMLGVHRTGSGKTYTMLLALEQYFGDPRPKILIFPTSATVNNFYNELLKFPNKYKDWLLRVRPGLAKTRGGSLSSTQLKLVKDMLAMKGAIRHRGEDGQLAAPLRAYSYTQAGGSKLATDALLKIPNGKSYSDKVYVMDEFHNLVRPAPEVAKYKDKLSNLRKLLFSAERSVVLGFTATPVVDNKADVTSLVDRSERITEWQALLETIKGSAGYRGNSEGYVSYFNTMPPSTYPSCTPTNPEASLPSVILVEMGKGGNAEVYLQKHQKLAKDGDITRVKDFLALQNYCNAGIFYTQFGSAKTKMKLQSEPKEWATKLQKIATDIVSRPQSKALVLIHRANGLKIFAQLLASAVKEVGRMCNGPKCTVMLYEKGDASDKNVAVFNSNENKTGTVIRVIVADTKEFSEGVSFFGVRDLYLVNPSHTWKDHKQRVGRALRSCGHDMLEPSQRTVNIHMYVATCPDVSVAKGRGKKKVTTIHRVETVDEICYNKLREQSTELETVLSEKFGQVAADAAVLAPIVGAPPKGLKMERPPRQITVADTLRDETGAAVTAG
jgi:hypothetical protein